MSDTRFVKKAAAVVTDVTNIGTTAFSYALAATESNQ